MPRCLMAKKWKAYPWPDRQEDVRVASGPLGEIESDESMIAGVTIDTVERQTRGGRLVPDTEDEEIDVVGDGATTGGASTLSNSGGNDAEPGAGNRASRQTCWGPHSPTAGATAPSPPPLDASGALYYHGYSHEAWLNHEEPPEYATLRSAAELARPNADSPTPDSQRQRLSERSDGGAPVDSTIEARPSDASVATVGNRSSSLRRASRSPSPPPPPPPPRLTDSSAPTLRNDAPPRKSLSVCYTSTGTTLSLPPKKKDIYRPYSLQTCAEPIIRSSAEEDLSAARAILDLSASPAAPSRSVFVRALSPPPPPLPPVLDSPLPAIGSTVGAVQPAGIPASVLVAPAPSSRDLCDANGSRHGRRLARHCSTESGIVVEPPSPATAESRSNGGHPGNGSPGSPPSGDGTAGNRTVAYTYEAFFVSDGRSKRRASGAAAVFEKETLVAPERPKFTCTECGKQYATSSNLSRHKQTHRSLDSQSAKKCIHCGKAYVSMPALAMHVLTHKLAHSCGVCGKMFSRPWLLQGHLRSHTGEKPYGCAHCGKAFADRSNLRAHMQTHSADKNYECSRCRKTFALKSYLNKHLESACLRDEETSETEPASPDLRGVRRLDRDS